MQNITFQRQSSDQKCNNITYIFPPKMKKLPSEFQAELSGEMWELFIGENHKKKVAKA